MDWTSNKFRFTFMFIDVHLMTSRIHFEEQENFSY